VEIRAQARDLTMRAHVEKMKSEINVSAFLRLLLGMKPYKSGDSVLFLKFVSKSYVITVAEKLAVIMLDIRERIAIESSSDDLTMAMI